MVKKKNFEQALEAAELIIESLEQGDMSLEESMKKYQEGFELLSFCEQELASAEQKFQELQKKVEYKGD